jgi:integrase
MRTPATVVRYLAVLSHAFSVAVKEWEWLSESPMPKVAKPKVRNDRARFLNEDECKRLLAAAKGSANSYMHTILLTALSTGMRYTEIMTLRWRDVLVDASASTALIVLNDTKNGERRGVPLVGGALRGILKLRETQEKTKGSKFSSDDLLFPSADHPTKPVEIRKAWETTLGRAKITDFRFHDLRHTAASYLAMDGATAPEIAEVLGHKDLKMVKRYAHLGKEHMIKIVSRMNASRLNDTE